MNYLFRPTPVVVLGRDRGADVVMLSQPPAGVMLGSPGRSSRPSRSLATQGAPWIVRSGTMASFGTLGNVPTGLGQDGIDTSGVDVGSDIPTDPGSGIDWSSLTSITPNLPAPVPPDFPVAPDIGLPSLPSGMAPFSPVPWASPAPPVPTSGAGATGQSIPGTQPLFKTVTEGVSIFERIFGRNQPAKNIALPGVGVNPKQPAPSFWNTSTIVPGTPNSSVILLGAAGLLLVFALMGSKGK